MPDFEKRVTVAVDAETAFNFLADPGRLPVWVVGMRLEDAVAVEGDPALQDEGEAHTDAPEARFLPNRAARTVEWGIPGGEYSGSATVGTLMASMSTVTVRLHLPDGADQKAVEAALDQSVKNLQRQITGG